MTGQYPLPDLHKDQRAVVRDGYGYWQEREEAFRLIKRIGELEAEVEEVFDTIERLSGSADGVWLQVLDEPLLHDLEDGVWQGDFPSLKTHLEHCYEAAMGRLVPVLEEGLKNPLVWEILVARGEESRIVGRVVSTQH